jgi:lysozyme
MDRQAVKERLRKFEGSITHMYRCTGGEVTIGIGHAIPDPAAASALQWLIDGSPANVGQVQADYAAVAACELGKVATFYASFSRCRMAGDQIDGLVGADIQAFETRLAEALPNWHTYPEPVQQALFDMAFNLGIGGLKRFKRLLSAVDAGDWNRAALECHRRGIGEARNEETAALFRQAAG